MFHIHFVFSVILMLSLNLTLKLNTNTHTHIFHITIYIPLQSGVQKPYRMTKKFENLLNETFPENKEMKDKEINQVSVCFDYLEKKWFKFRKDIYIYIYIYIYFFFFFFFYSWEYLLQQSSCLVTSKIQIVDSKR